MTEPSNHVRSGGCGPIAIHLYIETVDINKFE